MFNLQPTFSFNIP